MLQKLTQNQILSITFLLLVIVIFGWNNVLELRAEEPRRAIVSIEMLLRGEYFVPQIHNWSYYNKPPVFNWSMVLFFKLFGSLDEWVVRLPSLLSYFTIALLMFVSVKQFLTKEVALFSSLFFLTTADILFYGTVNAGEIDLFFSLIVFGQIMAFFVFHERKQFFSMFFISYLFAAIGTLTKGPPSIAFQGLTLLPWLLVNRQWKLLFSWKHFFSIAIFIMIVGGYFYQYSKYDDALGFIVRLFKEASQRSGMEQNIWETVKQSALFPLYLFQLLLPWSFLGFFFFRKDFISIIKSNNILYFSLIFIFFNIPIYWFTADHKARYLYPFFPFFCILFSYFFMHNPIHLQKRKKIISHLFLGIMALVTIAFLTPLFIPETKDIQNVFWKCLLLTGFGVGLILVYRKKSELKLSVFICFIILLRLGINLIYLPATAKHSSKLIYKQQVANVLAITKDQPVHWIGEPYKFDSDASIGPITFKKVTLTSAPLIAYQIPYYLTKGNKHIMQYDTTLLANHYYLAHNSSMKDSTSFKILYRFPDKWLNKEVVLFRTE